MDQTTHAFRAAQRSPANLVLYTAIAAIVCLLPQVPGMRELLGLTSGQLVRWVGSCLLATAIATALYHRVPETSWLYRVAALTEATTLQVGLVIMVVLSGKGTSLLWLVFISFATLEAGITEARVVLGALVIMPPLGAAVAFLVLRHDLAAAIACVLVGALSALVFLASSRAHLRREEALAELADLKLRDERRRIARDLHDGAAADLAAIVWKAEALRLRAGDDPVRRAELQGLVTRASEGIDEVRSIVWALRRDGQPWGELVAYLRQRCSELSEACRVLGEDEDSTREVPGVLVVEVLRIVQEAVRNAVRHADARHIEVRLAWHETLTITVDDDGRGLPAEANQSRGGLANLQVRARACGGGVQFERLSPGTRVRVWLHQVP